MKKMFLILTMMFLSASLYAIEVSFGISGEYIETGILRGSDANLLVDALGDIGINEIYPLSFFPAGQIDLMLELTPFFAIETGIGYATSVIAFEGRYFGVNADVVLARKEVTIPFLLRLQVETKNQVYYMAAGVKLGIPVTDSYVEVNASLFGLNENLYLLDSEFTLDASFVLGVENRLIGSHYLGARMGYDMNIRPPFEDEHYDDFFHDSFYGSITYRYAFNSKWNKPKNTTQKLDPNVI